METDLKGRCRVVVPFSGGMHSLAAWHRARRQSSDGKTVPILFVVVNQKDALDAKLSESVAQALETSADDWGNLGWDKTTATWDLAVVLDPSDRGSDPSFVSAVASRFALAVGARSVAWGLPLDHPARSAVFCASSSLSNSSAPVSLSVAFPFPDASLVAECVHDWLCCLPDPQRLGTVCDPDVARGGRVCLDWDEHSEEYLAAIDALLVCPFFGENDACWGANLLYWCVRPFCSACRRSQEVLKAATENVLDVRPGDESVAIRLDRTRSEQKNGDCGEHGSVVFEPNDHAFRANENDVRREAKRAR